ncbi:MAG: Hsp20/alpha crystallin family protein [Nitrospirae bacterium]|nr:Hsp20/alpha crystallin family protein [Nitrospirota bacterium]
MLVKWDPFNELARTIQWWDTQPFRKPLGEDSPCGVANWTPAVNVYEDTDKLYLEAQLPGIDVKDINISVTDHTLQLSGERSVEREDKKDGYHFREAQYGKFSRTFTLPSYVNPEEAKAGYDRGVLTITVPKQEKAKPRVIPIEAK